MLIPPSLNSLTTAAADIAKICYNHIVLWVLGIICSKQNVEGGLASFFGAYSTKKAVRIAETRHKTCQGLSKKPFLCLGCKPAHMQIEKQCLTFFCPHCWCHSSSVLLQSNIYFQQECGSQMLLFLTRPDWLKQVKVCWKIGSCCGRSCPEMFQNTELYQWVSAPEPLEVWHILKYSLSKLGMSQI